MPGLLHLGRHLLQMQIIRTVRANRQKWKGRIRHEQRGSVMKGKGEERVLDLMWCTCGVRVALMSTMPNIKKTPPRAYINFNIWYQGILKLSFVDSPIRLHRPAEIVLILLTQVGRHKHIFSLYQAQCVRCVFRALNHTPHPSTPGTPSVGICYQS